MHLIIKRNSPVFLSQRRHLLDRTNASTHRIHALKRNDLGCLEWVLGQSSFEVRQVIMFKYLLGRARVSDTVDHGCVIQFVGEDDASWKLGSEGGERGVVGYVA